MRGPTDAPRERRPIVLAVFGLYVVGLLLVVLWPQHVDRGLVPFTTYLNALFPVLTYPRIEFTANILLFVPPAALLTSLLRGYPKRRLLIAPLGFAASAVIEGVQDLLLPGRTASVLDVIANGSGVTLGVLATLLIERMRQRGRVSRTRPSR